MKFSAMAIAAALIAAAGAAQATTIDFETGAPCCFAYTSPLTTYYSSLGVTFGGVGGQGGSILDQSGNFGINARSGSDFLAFNQYFDSGVEQVSFASPVDGFSIYVGDGNSATYTAQAFDSNGVLLGTTQVSPGGGQYGELVLADANI
ncbi:MAG: hypothetical protein JOZ27_06430, partial [Caulobacteraceae bacterium]|nr:hypothetical protein [Caulobacteraceae bacterium]